jgi:glycerol-3-phosphate dehydrogenase
MSGKFDIVVIGAGVVGSAIARDLSKFELKLALIEARPDFGDESSKGNSALMTEGFDTPRGTLERQLVVRGYQRYLEEAPGMGLPIRKVGTLIIAWTDEQKQIVEAEVAAAREDGFHTVSLLDGVDVYKRWPHFGPGIQCALWSTEEAIGDPFSTPYAYVLDSVSNGTTFLPAWPVAEAERLASGGWRLRNSASESIEADLVVNAGGLRADLVEALGGFRDFEVRPRRGQYLVLDKSARAIHDVIAMPTPTPISRGILIAPTIFGNVIVGPTAEDVPDRDDRRTTPEGVQKLREAMAHMVPALADVPVNTLFAGMRPATNFSEYQIIPRSSDGWLTVAGIRSSGFTGSLGIAEHVVRLIKAQFRDLKPKGSVKSIRVPDLSETSVRPWQDNAKIDADPAYGEMACHCERISMGEIRDALASPVPPATIKGLKRRTRAMFGGCQGFYCGARIQRLFDEAQSRPREHDDRRL